MPPAIIAAGVVAAGTIGGAVLGSHSQSQASSQAAATQQQATDAQLQLGQESLAQQNALAQQSIALGTNIYNSNYDLLSPFVSRGNVAGDAYSAMLGLPAAPVMQSPLHSTAPPAPPTGTPPPVATPTGTPPSLPPPGPSAGGIPSLQTSGLPLSIQHLPGNETMTPVQTNALAPANQAPVATGHPALDNLNASRAARGLPPIGQHVATAPAATGSATTPAAATNALSPQQTAFNNFANSAGMEFQLKQGENAIQNNYAAHGALQSGSAMKSLSDYAQQTALNNYFMPYMGMLNGEQAMGAQSAAAVAGVGSSFGNSVAGINSNLGSNSAAINTNMGNAINSGAQNIGNLQLANGQNQANLFGTIGSSFGNLAGQAVGSGAFGSPAPTYNYWGL